ncbi:hypothetical protein TWF694_003373 [Orbilia ellipsospora]|uniref:VWFA domain-containing protein n=1 Tax=Orbilia ellipsospora TaxID=2528407 RepID=A0AAV9WXU4_9PEZI
MSGIITQFRSKVLHALKHDNSYDEKHAPNNRNSISFERYKKEQQIVQPTSHGAVETEAVFPSTPFDGRSSGEQYPAAGVAASSGSFGNLLRKGAGDVYPPTSPTKFGSPTVGSRVNTNNYHVNPNPNPSITRSPNGSIRRTDFQAFAPSRPTNHVTQSKNHTKEWIFFVLFTMLSNLKVFLVHDSTSMMIARNLHSAYEFLEKYHPHAVDYGGMNNVEIRFMSDNRKAPPLRTLSKDEFFRRTKPGSCMPLVNALEILLDPFEESVKKGGRLDDKHGGLNVIIITDGIDPDRDSVAGYIVEIAGKLSGKKAARNLVGCQFVHVSSDEDGMMFCEWLDDKLPVDRDIVDMIQYNADDEVTEYMKAKVLLGSVNKTLDNSD